MLNPFEKRIPALMGAALAVGIAVGFAFPEFQIVMCAALGVCGVSLMLPRRARALGVGCVCAALGIFLIGLQQDRLSAGPAEGSVEGELCTYPRLAASGDVVLTLDDCTVNGKPVAGRIRLFAKSVPMDIECGNRLAAEGKLTPPQPRVNPHTADSRLNAWARGIRWNMSADSAQNLGGISALTFPMRLRAKMENALYTLSDDRGFALLNGMMFGDTSGIDADSLDAMRAAGIGHIFAVSGLHVGLFAVALAYMLGALGLKSRKRLPLVAALLLLYCTLTGFTPSVMRATLMFLMALAAQAVYERPDLLNAAGTAAFFNLAANPVALFTPSFALSYSAVLGICAFSHAFDGLTSKLKGKIASFLGSAMTVTLCAQLGTLLPQLHFFGVLSPWAFLANVLVSPFVPCALIAGWIGAALGAAWLPLGWPFVKLACLAAYPIELAGRLVDFLPFSRIITGEPTLLMVMGLIALMALPCMWTLTRKARSVQLAIAAACLCMALAVNALDMRGAKLTVLSAGNSDAISLRSGRAAVLIDGGNAFDTYDAGKSVVLPFLYGEGISSLDAVFVTHPHSDHYGGLVSVVKEMDVGVIVIGKGSAIDEYGELAGAALERGVPVVTVSAGDVITAGDALITVVDAPENAADANDESLLLSVECFGSSALMMGDATVTEEENSMDLLPRSDILKVGHHGAKTSTGSAMLQKVRPQLAIISVGRSNSYGHPSPDTLERLEDAGVDVLRTDERGAITVRFESDGMEVYTMLQGD